MPDRSQIRVWVFCILSLISILQKSEASHLLGADIAYQHTGNDRYAFVIKFYRDCRGIPFNSPQMEFRCLGSSVRITPSYNLVDIREISPLCASAGKKCTPMNTTNTGSEISIEQHTYRFTYDFSLMRKNGCCKIQFGVGQSGRSNAITTGAAGEGYWTWAELDICLPGGNSSPVFEFPNHFVAFCNQPLRWSFWAKDTLDHDSLSYEWVDPSSQWDTKTKWNTGYSSQEPFTPFWPLGYDKSRGPDPLANPPIGIWLDPVTGVLIATPTNCAEISIYALAVSEWRKDSTGRYQKIGVIVKDVQLFVLPMISNYSPTLTRDTVYSVCEGQSLSFKIVSGDSSFLPAPPGKAILNDTVKIAWRSDIPDAKVVLDSTRLKQPALTFNWIPQQGSGARAMPYVFSIEATDNACPYPAITVSSVKVFVWSIPVPELDWNLTGDSVFFFDRSKNVQMRTWFIEEMDRGNGPVLGLKRLEVEGKRMRVQLENGDCRTDTLFEIGSLEIGLSNKADLSVFPNPARENLTIVREPSSSNPSFEMYDPLGKCVLSGNLRERETVLDLKTLESGIYYLRVEDKPGSRLFIVSKMPEH